MVTLTQFRLSSERIENGGWVDGIPDFGDLRLHVRGVFSAAYQNAAKPGSDRTAMKRMATHRRQLKAVLLGWENLELTPGLPLPYSPEAADILIDHPDFETFRMAVFWAAQNVGRMRPDDDMGDVFESLKAIGAHEAGSA